MTGSDFGKLQKRDNTYFAPAERAGSEELIEAAMAVAESPVMDVAMQALGGWVAVLNETRQVLAVNHAFLEALGLADPQQALGLRPGEAVGCAYAREEPGGCGTSKHCVTCGAAIAMVAALSEGRMAQRECALVAERNGRAVEHAFSVNCLPFEVDGRKLLLVSMRDISAEKRRMSMERAFLHDVSNILTGLAGASELLSAAGDQMEPDVLHSLQDSAKLLVKEVQVQRTLVDQRGERVKPEFAPVRPSEVLMALRSPFRSRFSAAGQSMKIELPTKNAAFDTDASLLHRVLCNMVTNALEAGEPGDAVRVWVEQDDASIIFLVHNVHPIPPAVALRVFQRYYSTKGDGGRGVGTYAMKLLGEELLGGEVSFDTSEDGGTAFRIRLPRTAD